MKNFINYYYNLNIYNISLNNGRYFFYNGTDRYMLKLYENNPNNLSSYVELSYQLKKYEHFFSLIINRDNQYITLIDNKLYFLIKLCKNACKKQANIILDAVYDGLNVLFGK